MYSTTPNKTHLTDFDPVLIKATRQQNRGNMFRRFRSQLSNPLPFLSGGDSEEGDFLVKVKRVKLFGKIKFVRRTRRRFFIDNDKSTINYERARKVCRFRKRKRKKTFSVKISDVTTTR